MIFKMTNQIKKAAIVFIQNENKILAVSRKHNFNDFGLPGGKVEEGESFVDAARRELFEETGLQVDTLKEIFERDSKRFRVKTFTPNKFWGEIKSSEEGKVLWVEPKILVAGSFSEYNSNLFKSLNLKY